MEELMLMGYWENVRFPVTDGLKRVVANIITEIRRLHFLNV